MMDVIVDPQRVRARQIDATDPNLPDETRRAVEAYHRAEAKPGGATRLSNLIETLFELYQTTPEEVASASGTLARLSPLRIQHIRQAIAADVLYMEAAEICRIFDVDFCYLEFPRATEADLDPAVARVREFRTANPDLGADEILRERLLDYGKQAGWNVNRLVDALCKEVFSCVRVPDPDEVEAFLTGLDERPPFLRAAAGHLLGHPYRVWMELWGEGWWRNDLSP